MIMSTRKAVAADAATVTIIIKSFDGRLELLAV